MFEYKGYPAKWAQAQTLESGKPEFLSWLCHFSQVAPGESHNLCELVSYLKVGIMLAPTQQGCSEDEMRLCHKGHSLVFSAKFATEQQK